MSAAAYPTDRYGWMVFGFSIMLLSGIAITMFKEWTGVVLTVLAFTPFILFSAGKNKGLIVYGLVLLSILAIDNKPGLNLREAVYYAYLVACAGLISPYLLVTGQWKFSETTDKAITIFMGFIIYGIIMGFISDGQAKARTDDLVYFAPFFVYPVLRHHMVNDRIIRNIALIILFIIIAISIRNLLNYQQMLLQAVMEWQVQKARVAKNEVFLLLGSTAFFIIQAYQTKWIPRLFSLGLFGIFFGALVLTQSRGYWLAFFLAAALFFLFSQGRIRIRAIITCALLGAVAITVAFSLYYDAMILFIENLTYRLSLTSKGIDISLLERVQETESVMQLIRQNPIAGYGIGYPYSRYSVISGFHEYTGYAHNGYLALWMKFGFFGLLAGVALLVSMVRTGYRLYRKAASPFAQIMGLIIMCQVSGMMLVNITSPQFLGFDSTVLMCILAAITASLSQIHLKDR